jgi:TetR/AcrR family transcriptional regulator
LIGTARADTLARMPRLRAGDRREQLLAVATRIFAERGYDASTTASIAAAAGVTEPVLYRHFRGKQALFLAVVRGASRRTIEQWKQITAATPNPQNCLRLIAAILPAHVNRAANSYHILHGAISTSRDRRVLAAARAHYRQLHRIFARVVTQARKRRPSSRHTSASISWHLVLLALGYAMISLNIGPFDDTIMSEALHNVIGTAMRAEHAEQRGRRR